MKQYPYPIGVLIGRFQPFHLGHWHLVKHGLAQCEKVLILIGSVNLPRSRKNPFTYEERAQLIQTAVAELSPLDQDRVITQAIQDMPGEDEQWIEQVRASVLCVGGDGDSPPRSTLESNSVALISYEKDASTYYLKYFAGWGQIQVDNYYGVNATQIREQFFQAQSQQDIAAIAHIPHATRAFLTSFFKTDYYQALRST